MYQERRFQNTIRALRDRWPTFLSTYLGIISAVVVIGISLLNGWFAFVPMALGLIIFLVLFLIARLWALYHLFDEEGIRPHDRLFDLGNVQATEMVVYIDYGERYRGLDLVRRLSSGRMIVVDIYNPQWMPNPRIVRQRRRMPAAISDPRLLWKESQLGLLPLPDESVSVVIMCNVLRELAQRGDQTALLEEIYRVMKPYGRLLFCERCRTPINVLLLEGFWFQPVRFWQQLLKESGFRLQKTASHLNLLHTFRAIKPTPYEARQMALDLKFDV